MTGDLGASSTLGGWARDSGDLYTLVFGLPLPPFLPDPGRLWGLQVVDTLGYPPHPTPCAGARTSPNHLASPRRIYLSEKK